MDLTTWIETLKPWTELDCVSGAYLAKDFEHPLFAKQVQELVDFGEKMPKVRLWEHARVLIFLGNVRGKRILDVGTRESLVPQYLWRKGAQVTCLESDLTTIPGPAEGLTLQEGDIRNAPFRTSNFDVVLCTAVLKHIPGWGDRKAMQEMVRITRPGGLIAVSFDFSEKYWPFGNAITGKRIYDVETVMSRLVRPVSKLAEVAEPLILSRVDWNDWPIKQQSTKVYETGVNVQVAFLLFRKKGGQDEKVAEEAEVELVPVQG